MAEQPSGRYAPWLPRLSFPCTVSGYIQGGRRRKANSQLTGWGGGFASPGLAGGGFALPGLAGGGRCG